MIYRILEVLWKINKKSSKHRAFVNKKFTGKREWKYGDIEKKKEFNSLKGENA